MNVYALQTARAGSKSVPNKNILNIKGKSLYLHNIHFAQQSKLVQDVFISTDYDIIKKDKDKYGNKIIDRPEYLSTDDCSHHDTMIHGLQEIEKVTNKSCDILVVLFGNTLGARTEDLDSAIDMLISNPEADSVQAVSEYTMFNPFRAFKVDEKGFLDTIVSQDFIKEKSLITNINDRNSAGETYFMNGSFWVIRKEVLLAKKGKLPFPFLGYNILPYHQETLMEIDAPWQIKFLESGLGFSSWPFKK